MHDRAVASVQANDDGGELHGTVALPKWLDDTIGAAERKVSATWDRATKRLTGLALVLNPRVSDAALFASFSGSQGRATAETQVSAKEIERLLALTPGGRATLAMRQTPQLPSTNRVRGLVEMTPAGRNLMRQDHRG
jgi:hypothetical protein